MYKIYNFSYSVRVCNREGTKQYRAMCHPHNFPSCWSSRVLASCRGKMLVRRAISRQEFVSGARKQSSVRIEDVCRYSWSAFIEWWRGTRGREGRIISCALSSHQPFNFPRMQCTSGVLLAGGELSPVSIAQSQFIGLSVEGTVIRVCFCNQFLLSMKR